MTRLRTGRPKNQSSISHIGSRFFSHSQHPDRLWVPTAVVCPTEEIWSGREADHLPSDDEVKEYVEPYLNYTCIFMPWCLIKHRVNFTFMFKEVWENESWLHWHILCNNNVKSLSQNSLFLGDQIRMKDTDRHDSLVEGWVYCLVRRRAGGAAT